ncbi:MAG: sensor histidine kinase N-terminal domain-containing protein [Bdellovibrionales bacterium]|nr:sensor histidine kinase N-terminal domain-containing protein [Ramlibacter sp.]
MTAPAQQHPAAGASAAAAPSAASDVVHSLRKRLLLLLFAAIAIFATVQGVGAYRGALQLADAMFDYHLQQVAHAMPRGMDPRALPGVGADDLEDDLLVQIWGPDGVQLFRSPRSALPQSGVLGFSDVKVLDTAYRVYTVQTAMQTVQIAQDMSARNARARAIAARAVLPVVLMAPLLMLVVWWVVSRSLAPVERARRQVAGRAADDLSPLEVAGLPDEVRPLVQELNGLFARVASAFEAQQQFVANAAHELRSPLAALKLHAQALRANGIREASGASATDAASGNNPPDDAGTAASTITNPDTPAREIAVTRLNQGIDRAIHLVEQLLALARAEDTAQQPVGKAGTIDLQNVVRLAVGDVLPLAQARGIDLGLAPGAATAELKVRGDAEALRMMLRNLLDNAVKYSPCPGQVDVDLQEDAQGAAVLAVEDSGPGIRPDERELVFDRFYRSPEAAAHATGSGLGLSIVRAIALRHGASLNLTSGTRLHGLRAEVRFSPA